MPADATGARFMNDQEHEAKMADRLLAMCHWKEKLELGLDKPLNSRVPSY